MGGYIPMECLLNSDAMMVNPRNGRIRRGWCALDLEIWFDWIVHDHASIQQISSGALTLLLARVPRLYSGCVTGRPLMVPFLSFSSLLLPLTLSSAALLVDSRYYLTFHLTSSTHHRTNHVKAQTPNHASYRRRDGPLPKVRRILRRR
jgi:hypothetical protein